jgi:FixJ family two-component response regulator
MTDAPALVFVVDDDPSVRTAVGRLLRSAGFRAGAFASAEEFLRHERPDAPGCLVLDLRMPGVNGLELQRRLNEPGPGLPIVFLTGYGDIPTTVRAMKGGAVDFLPKPVHDEDLLAAVRSAVAQDAQARQRRGAADALRHRLGRLTAREREVLVCVVAGMLNKQTARRLGVTEKTIKVHRAQVMAKMEARSLADLVRLAEKVGIGSPAGEAPQ